ncbi:MAG: STAS domain-containing protein [Micromonosporaceae bacterium]
MNTTCRIVPRSGDGVLRIAVSGELDLAAHDELFQAIASSHSDGVTELVIDLDQVTFIDSGAVGVLVAGRNAAHRVGHGYRVVNPSPMVRRVLETNGILQLLNTTSSPPPSESTPVPGDSNG